MMKHTVKKFQWRGLSGLLLMVCAVGATLTLTQAKALNAADVCKQNTILGVTGTKSCVGQNDGDGTVPAVTTLNSVETRPTMPAIFSNTAPTVDVAKICSNQTLLGNAGTATCTARVAMNHRDTTLSSSALTENFASVAPRGRMVPMIKDDDGQQGTNVTKFNRSSLNVCGTAATTLAGKIANCLTHNGAASQWNGSNGNAGHGNWTLVQAMDGSSVDGDACLACKEIWRDDRTGLLWSDLVSQTLNWCRASGSDFFDADCKGSNQSNTPDSACAEVAGSATASGFDAAKGNLRLTTGTIKVRWWLPTRADWMQAEENGLRFVLPNMGRNFWTATADSGNVTLAWIYTNASNAGGGFDVLDATPSTGMPSTRCIGQAL